MDLPTFKLRAAAVHAAPVYMDKEKTTAKVVQLIEEAGKQDLQLLVFPEVFIPGYPYFIEAYPPLAQVQALAQYARQSIVCTPDDPSIRAIQAACRTAGVTISLGVSERMADGGYTLFNSQVFIEGGSGALLGVHRKLQPTYAERMVWAQGDGSTLKVWPVGSASEENSNSSSSSSSSVSTPRYKLGGLCCWENTMNGARQALIEQGQHVHAAAWPALSVLKGFEDLADAQIEALMKTHALTAQVFVVCAANYVDDGCLEWMERNLGPQEYIKKGGGWSAVIHPFCSFLAGPHTGDEEKFVVAELDFENLGLVKVWIDGNGHFKRPEVLDMKVNTESIWPRKASNIWRT